MFVEKMENINKFEVGGVYSYAFACDSDSFHTMQVVSISETRKTAIIRDYYGENHFGKEYRKKIYINSYGEEAISAGNYSMAGSWYSSERVYAKRYQDFDLDFMYESEVLNAIKPTIEMTSSEPTDPDDDPTSGKPENFENDTAYSKFDSFFNSCNIISVTFGGTQNSAEASTEKRQLEEIAEKLEKGVKLIDGQTIKKIDKYDEENNTLDVESCLVYTVEGCCYDVFDFCDGVTGFDEVSEPEQPLENQISFDDVAYSKNEQPEQAAAVPAPINEELARWAHESHSFSDYKTGSATAGYNAQVAEVAELAEKVKSSAPEEFHSEIDSLVSRYASRLAEWTNRRNRIENSCPSWFVSGPANYPMRKFKKQQAALKNCYDDLEKIEHIKARIKNFANRPIMSGDESAIDRLTEKVEKLRKKREEMKQENAEARKAGKTAPYGSYTLSNSLANLRTAEKRLEELKKAKETPTAAADDLKNEFCEVVRNTDIMRLQLIFSGKPDDETRNILKSNGFKWAPSQKACQRQLNNNAVYAAKRVFSSLAELTAKS